jgi:probable HAF family extracellular repeat protein
VARGVNNAGQVIGHFTTADGKSHFFVWANGKAVDLGVAGDKGSETRSINDAGLAVGTVNFGQGGSIAVAWQVDLASLTTGSPTRSRGMAARPRPPAQPDPPLALAIARARTLVLFRSPNPTSAVVGTIDGHRPTVARDSTTRRNPRVPSLGRDPPRDGIG